MHKFLKYEEINFSEPVLREHYEYAMKKWPYVVDNLTDDINSAKRLIYINGVIAGIESQKTV